MELVVDGDSTLPAAAWCAEFQRGASWATVTVGPSVDVGNGWFVEGVWPSAFGDDGFFDAEVFVGSGGRETAGAAEFICSNGPFDVLAVARRGHRLWVSNSSVFALVAAGDEPDIRYTRYYDRLKAWSAAGIERRDHVIPAAHGTQWELYEGGQLRVTSDLDVRWTPRRETVIAPTPLGYEKQLVDILTSLRVNASQPGRRQCLVPVTTISSGFDSALCSALARQAGWDKALTLVSSGFDDMHGDSGVAMGRALGLDVTVVDKLRWVDAHPCAEAEFAVVRAGGVLGGYAAAEDVLTGALVITGANGGPVWGPDPILDNWAAPIEVAGGNAGMASLREWRLRVGSIVVSPASFGTARLAPVMKMLSSPELAPFDLGTEFERPFARFVVERAGVPRELLAARKRAGGHIQLPRGLSPESMHDVERFLDDRHPKGADAIRHALAGASRRRRILGKLPSRVRAVGPVKESLRRSGEGWWTRAPGPYMFQWAFARTAERYRPTPPSAVVP